MVETPGLSAGLLRAAGAIVAVAAARDGRAHWRSIADRLVAAADAQSQDTEQDAEQEVVGDV